MKLNKAIPAVFLMSLQAGFHPIVEAGNGFDSCQSCCLTSSWLPALGAALATGLAAGAGTGYVAGNHRGSKGKEGPPGPPGPSSDVAIEFNTTNPLMVDFQPPPGQDFFVRFDADLRVETVELTDRFTVRNFPVSGIVISLPPSASKLVGDYYLILRITQNSDPMVAIGEFFLLDGVSIVPFELVFGPDPTQPRDWLVGERVGLRATFNP